MKSMIFTASAAFAMVCGAGISSCSSTDKHVDEVSSDTIADENVEKEHVNPAGFLGLGWNLGNQFDAYSDGVSGETAWGNKPVTQALMDSVKAAGFNSVRIPVTWMGHIGDAPGYTVDSKWLDRVAEVVGYAEKAGLNAVVNIHHDGADSKNWLNVKEAAKSEEANKKITDKLKAVWTQIAKKFSDKGDFLIFESMNEIHDGGWGWGDNIKDGGKQYAVLNGWNQAFVDAVRATGGNNTRRWLATPTYCTNIDLGEYFVMPKDTSNTDNRVIVAVHCYEPYEYAIEAKYPEWGHSGESGKKPTNGEKQLEGELDKIVDKWVSKGIPVYIGEFGSVHRQDSESEKFRLYYLEYYSKTASDRDIPIFYWDNGYDGFGKEQFGLFDRATGTYLNNGHDVVGSMKRGYYNTSQDYTLESVYNSAPN